jgi:hypothetical protein
MIHKDNSGNVLIKYNKVTMVYHGLSFCDKLRKCYQQDLKENYMVIGSRVL